MDLAKPRLLEQVGVLGCGPIGLLVLQVLKAAGAQIVPELLAKAKAKGKQIHLPVDWITADKFDPAANTGTGSALFTELPLPSCPELFRPQHCSPALTTLARAPPGSLRRLLEGLAVVAHEAGHPGILVYVDSDDLALVNAARLAGFHHDRTDVRYQLGGSL